MTTGKISLEIPQKILDAARGDQALLGVLVKSYVGAELESNGFKPSEIFVSPQLKSAEGQYFKVVFHE